MLYAKPLFLVHDRIWSHDKLLLRTFARYLVNCPPITYAGALCVRRKESLTCVPWTLFPNFRIIKIGIYWLVQRQAKYAFDQNWHDTHMSNPTSFLFVCRCIDRVSLSDLPTSLLCLPCLSAPIIMVPVPIINVDVMIACCMVQAPSLHGVPNTQTPPIRKPYND